MNGQDIDMLVVSNGVTGMTMALALATHGLRVHIVAKSSWLDPSPDTQLIDRRSMAIFRELGVADDLVAVANSWPRLGGAVYADSLDGPQIARITPSADRVDRPIDIAQSALVNTLLCRAATRGATVAFNGEYLGHQQDEHGVSVTLHDAVLDRIYTMRAGFLFGADGYRSDTEEACAVIPGASAAVGTIEARFTADLAARLGDRADVFNWIATPDAAAGRTGAGLLRAISPWSEWVARWDVDLSGDDALAEPDRDHVRRCIARMIGDDAPAVALGAVRLLPVSHKVAQARGKGRVFCGGDVIRYLTHPGGPGTNSGIQDAHDLAWKLAMVAHGQAGAGLLDSYAVERAPVEPARLTLVAGGKGATETPLQHFVTGPAGSKEIAATLCAPATSLPARDHRRSAIARPPAPRSPSAQQHAARPSIRQHAGH